MGDGTRSQLSPAVTPLLSINFEADAKAPSSLRKPIQVAQLKPISVMRPHLRSSGSCSCRSCGYIVITYSPTLDR